MVVLCCIAQMMAVLTDLLRGMTEAAEKKRAERQKEKEREKERERERRRKRELAEEEERKIANAVLYGRREGHYDAKGFEVWDVGEMSEGAEGSRGDGEDDWEGEPVPWEAGEL